MMVVHKLRNKFLSLVKETTSFHFKPTIFPITPKTLLVRDYMHTSFSANDDKTYVPLLCRITETSDLLSTKAVHAKLLQKGAFKFFSFLFLCNHLMNAYLKCGDIENGRQVFDEMPHRNVVSWTALIAGLVQNGFSAEALCFLSQMHFSGIKPNEFTFVSALHACSSADCPSVFCALQVYGLIIRLGFASNVYLVNGFLTSLMSHSSVEEAREFFESCSVKNVVTWNAMLAGFLHHNCVDVPGFWCRMYSEGIMPDAFTFAIALTASKELLDLDLGVQVHGSLVKSGHMVEICLGNALIDMYSKNRKLTEGLKAFEEVPLKDVVAWTRMAAGCLSCGEPIEALKVIAEMRNKGLDPNKFTMASAFNACANLASLAEGEKFHGLRIKLAKEMDTCVDNALLDMYAQGGCMDGALRIFLWMDERTTVSWTTMIMGYAQNGCAEQALEIFRDMRQKGVEPNHITFLCVLYACSQGGFVEEGKTYFHSMDQDYGIAPGEDHYACMVNLLGREGYIKEAEELVQQMPFRPSLLIWQTLLGACRRHGDMRGAKRASEYVFHLDRTDSSACSMLSDTLARLNDWNSVWTLRQMVKRCEVKKMPGSSWIELN